MTTLWERPVADISVPSYPVLVMKAALFASILLAPILANCGKVEGERLAADGNDVCELVKNVVVAGGQYTEKQIAGCDGTVGNEYREGYIVVRLNGFCREEICGSVLLGWYAVQQTSGRVFEWNVADWSLGPEINRS